MTGAVPPGANIESLPRELSFEETGFVLAHNSSSTAQRIIQPNDPPMTCLVCFLGTDQTLHAFGMLENPPVAPAMENKELTMPVSMDYLQLAGDLRDIAANAPRMVERVQQQIDNIFTPLTIELIDALQTVDLRRQQ